MFIQLALSAYYFIYKDRLRVTYEEYEPEDLKLPASVSATGSFINGQLLVNVTARDDNDDQMFVAGYVEGFLTKQRIADAIDDFGGYEDVPILTKQLAWLEKQNDEGSLLLMAWMQGVALGSALELKQVYWLNSQDTVYYIDNENYLGQRQLAIIAKINGTLTTAHVDAGPLVPALNAVHRVLVLHQSKSVQRVHSEGLAGILGQKFALVHTGPEGFITQKVVATVMFPVNGSSFTVGEQHLPAGVYVAFQCIYGSAQKLIRAERVAGQFEVATVDLASNVTSLEQVIGGLSYHSEPLEGVVMLHNTPQHDAGKFGVDFATDYFGANDYRLKTIQQNIQDVKNTSDLVKLMIRMAAVPEQAIYPRMDTDHYGATSLKVADAAGGFSFNSTRGIAIGNEYKYKDRHNITKTYPQVSANTTLLPACHQMYEECDICSAKHFSMEKQCTTCQDGFFLFYKSGQVWTCDPYDFTTPTILLSVYFVVVVTACVIWVWYFFCKKVK